MYKQLTSEQRYIIFILLQNGTKKKDIAKAINVSPSTISREIKRNSGHNGYYNWETAQRNVVYRKRRKPGNRSIDARVKNEAVRLLTEEPWSPVQISGYLAKQEKHISHEIIYRIIRKDKRDGGSLYKNCRHRLKHRARPVGGKRISIPNCISISERPVEADGRRFGDFEMDTIVGKDGHGAIVTLTERSTNMLFIRKLNKGRMLRNSPKRSYIFANKSKDILDIVEYDIVSKHRILCCKVTFVLQGSKSIIIEDI